VVLDDEVDENDLDNNLLDRDEEVQTLKLKLKTVFLSVINRINILEGHKDGRVSNG